MHSFREPKASPLPPLSISLPIAVNVTMGIGTTGLLALLTGGRTVAAALSQLGNASEEVFRGEQLPTLPLMELLSIDKDHTD